MSPVDPSHPPFPPRFQLTGELGRGGMGVVYRARDIAFDRDVAIKILPPDLQRDDAFRRFRREASDLAALCHPNVVACHEVGEHDGHAFLVMELVDGPSLRKLMERPMDPQRAAGIFAAVCDGLEHAHARGIVHRDIKPENILIAPDGTPKITDFGLARRVTGESKLTRTGTVLGTAAYMAPEQAMSSHVGPAADLYAVGICLFEAVCGRRPFHADNEVSMLFCHLSDLPPSPSSIVANLSPAVDAAILRLLEKKPEQRPASAAEAARLLREAASASPTLDAPAGEADPRLRLVGRSADVAALVDALSGASLEAGAACILTAPSGRGRTRVLQEVESHLQGRGVRTLRVLPDSQPLASLGRVFHALGAEPEALGRALRDGSGPVAATVLLRLLGQGPPTALLADDVERVDATTKAVLDALVGLPPAPGRGWLISCEERSAPTHEARHFVLPPLSTEAVVELAALDLGGTPDPELAAWLTARAEGSPRLLRQLLRALREQGALREDVGTWRRSATVDLPQELASQVLAGVEGLDENARQLLVPAAVLDEPFEYDLLLDVCEMDEDAADRTVERLLDAGHLEEAWGAGRDAYRFASALLRDSLAASLSDRRRRRLHGRIAEALGKDASAAARGRHLSAAGRLAEAGPLLCAAAEDAHARAAFREAERLWEEASACREEASDTLRLSIGAAETQSALGCPDAARAALADVPWDAADDAVRVPLLRARKLVGRLDLRAARLDEALDHARSGLRLAGLPPGPTPIPPPPPADPAVAKEGAALYNLLATVLRRRGEMLPAVDCIASALSLARSIGDLEQEADLLVVQGLVQKERGEAPAAEASMRASLELGRRLGRPLHTLACLNNLGGIYNDLLSDPDRALATYSEALATAEEIGHPLWQAGLYSNLAVVHYTRGDWSHVSKNLERAVTIQRRIGAQQQLAHTLGNLGEARMADGDPEGAAAAYQESLRLSTDGGDRGASFLAQQGLGMLYLDRGQVDDAEQWLERAIRTAREADNRPGVIEATCHLVDALLASGRFDDALGRAREAIATAGELDDPYRRALAHRSRGDALTAALAWSDARESLEEARKALAPLGRPADYGRALESLAVWHLRANAAAVDGASLEEGLALLQSALKLYTGAGKFQRVQAVQREIDALLAAGRLARS